MLGVVAYHAYRLSGSGEGGAGRSRLEVWERPVALGRLGVDLFFVLSGFLVVGSWRSLRRRHGTWRACAEYLRKRAARLLPAYWLSLLVLVPLAAPSLLGDVRRLALFASLNQYLEPGLPAKVNTATWSLTTEMHFYLLVPVVAWLLHHLGRWLVLGACIALSLWWWRNTPYGLPASFIAGRLDQFVAGAVAAELVADHARGVASRVVRVLQLPGAGVALGAVALWLGTFYGASFGRPERGWWDHALHPLFAVVMAAWLVRLLTRDRRSMLETRWLGWVGLISYGLYLWHYPILLFGIRAARAEGLLATPTGALLACTALIGASLLAAALTHVAVERPVVAVVSRAKEPRRVQIEAAPAAHTAR